MSWSEEQVIALSPDDASARSGKDLARPEKWVSFHQNEKALWGECKGSGSKPYRTQIDLTEIAFKCSCPSRKFPCKHGLALLLLYAKDPSMFPDAALPDWVSEWLSKRAEREEKKSIKKEKPADEQAQAKRQQARQTKVSDGTDELLVWIRDIIRNGILSMPEKPPSFWETMSRRLVDAQAPGLARMVQSLGYTPFYSDHWQSRFLDQLLRIYLVVKGYQHIEALDAPLQEDIRSLIGFNQSQEELKAQTGITDHWLVLSKQTAEEETLTTEKYWLYGQSSGQYALILQFLIRGQGKTLTLTPGMTIQAELVFYPSAVPLRAIIRQQSSSNIKVTVPGWKNWQEVAQEEAVRNALSPFSNERPFVINHVKLVKHRHRWHMMDEENRLAVIKESFGNIYQLLAISGGEALNILALGRENNYEPLGAWFKDNYYLL